MSLRDDVPTLVQYWRDNCSTLDHNKILFEIHEGSLLPHVLADLKRQLNDNSYDKVRHRVPAINVLIRLVDKLSKIYIKPPIRTIVDGKKKDNKALGELIRVMNYDTAMAEANDFFNTFKSTWVEPYLYEGKPCLRSIPSDRFLVYSNDPIDPTRPTHLIKIMGKNPKDDTVIFYAYTKDEFIIYDSKGTVLTEQMAKLGNGAGVNEYRALPGVYINRSRHCLVPLIDTDMLSMAKLIPVLLADCNFAVMFQSFAIIYGIDVNDENLTMAPNAFWRFKSDPTAEGKTPQVGVLKPEVDTDKVITLVTTLMAMWLESKGIKAGTIGAATPENASSGIAKMIDSSDTTEDRKKQVGIFGPKDGELLELIINNFVPVWKADKNFTLDATFGSSEYRVTSEFPEQKPMLDETAATNTEVIQLDNKLTTRKRSIKKLNPDMTDEQVDELIADIEQESADNMQRMQKLGLPNPDDPTNPNNPPPDPNAPQPKPGEKTQPKAKAPPFKKKAS